MAETEAKKSLKKTKKFKLHFKLPKFKKKPKVKKEPKVKKPKKKFKLPKFKLPKFKLPKFKLPKFKKRAKPAKKKIEIEVIKSKIAKQYPVINYILIVLSLVAIVIAAVALVYATTVLTQNYTAIDTPTSIQTYAFISQILVTVIGLITMIAIIIYGSTGYKRSYHYLMWALIILSILCVVYICSEFTYELGFYPVLVSALAAMLVFGASQRLYDKKRAIYLLIAAFILSIIASIVITVSFKNTADYTKLVKDSLWYVVSTYIVIWTRTILIGIITCACIGRAQITIVRKGR